MDNWRDEAKCKDKGHHFFFPQGSAGGRLSEKDKAKRIERDRDSLERKAAEFCIGCPVKTPCLEWALSDGTIEGVAGGASYQERLAMRRNGRLRLVS